MNPFHDSITEYIAQREPWQQRHLNTIRNILLTFPEIREVFRYRTPFYDFYGPILYLTVHKKSKLIIGFVNGYRMQDPAGILKNDSGQKFIRHLELFPDVETNTEQIIQYIEEALRIKNELHEQKRTHRKSKSGG